MSLLLACYLYLLKINLVVTQILIWFFKVWFKIKKMRLKEIYTLILVVCGIGFELISPAFLYILPNFPYE